ncbi:maestro heat-like repeat family member 5 [Crotalus adamanteus]|uniref:Maestro heat-like repeat family member 5 n=1 Tax=Crotalus adamanteus TaxID=8729 RepID=A0AAW1AQU1_CROAD
MSRRLTKLPLLKKKDSKESNLQVNRDQQQWDLQEAHFSGSHPSTSQDAATRRTTQLLPLLVKSSAAPTQARKRVQLPALVLPDLGQRTTLRTTPGTAQADDQQGEKEPVALPRVPERESSERSSLSQGRRPSKALLPLYPELSDQCFQTFWESKEPLKGRSVTEMLEQMDEKEILDTILEHLRPSLHISAGPQLPRRKTDGLPSLQQKSALRESRSHLLPQEKISLYKYYGVKLRNSRQKDLVKEQLKSLLGFSFQEETDREGISEAIRVVAFCHLPEILVALRQVGHFVRAKKPALQEATFQDPHSCFERQIRTAVILCYGHAALGAQPEDLMPLAEHIVSEILFQYWTRNKDEALTKAFLTSVIRITKALVQTKSQDVHLPHKSELALNINELSVCMRKHRGTPSLPAIMAAVKEGSRKGEEDSVQTDDVGKAREGRTEVIENEPVSPLSVRILHQAIIAITCMTRLKPTLNTEVMSKLANTSIQKVFSLPAMTMTKVNAGSPNQSTYTQDLYHRTVTACSAMLTSLLSEAPNLDSLQEILMHTNIWIESPKIHERERAIKSTRYLLKFVSEQTDFDTTADFYLLGQLVALLGLHIGDSVKEIGQTSAEAAYHLHCIILNKMGIEGGREGTEGGKGERGGGREGEEERGGERGRGGREGGGKEGRERGREGGREGEREGERGRGGRGGRERGGGREREGERGEREGGREREEGEGGEREGGREREGEGEREGGERERGREDREREGREGGRERERGGREREGGRERKGREGRERGERGRGGRERKREGGQREGGDGGRERERGEREREGERGRGGREGRGEREGGEGEKERGREDREREGREGRERERESMPALASPTLMQRCTRLGFESSPAQVPFPFSKNFCHPTQQG